MRIGRVLARPPPHYVAPFRQLRAHSAIHTSSLRSTQISGQAWAEQKVANRPDLCLRKNHHRIVCLQSACFHNGADAAGVLPHLVLLLCLTSSPPTSSPVTPLSPWSGRLRSLQVIIQGLQIRPTRYYSETADTFSDVWLHVNSVGILCGNYCWAHYQCLFYVSSYQSVSYICSNNSIRLSDTSCAICKLFLH